MCCTIQTDINLQKESNTEYLAIGIRHEITSNDIYKRSKMQEMHIFKQQPGFNLQCLAYYLQESILLPLNRLIT